MSTDDIANKLTPAAQQTLDEIIRDRREEILLAAAANASRATGEIREISVQDIVRGLQDVTISPQIRRRTFVDRVFSTYAIVGIVTGLAGVITFIVQNPPSDYNIRQQLPVIIGLSGIVMTAISIAYIYIKRLREHVSYQDKVIMGGAEQVIGQYLLTWRNIEVAIRILAASQLGESVAQEPISFLIDRLRKKQLLAKNDAERLQRMLDTRNSLAHSDREIQITDLKPILHDAQNILRRLGDYKEQLM